MSTPMPTTYHQYDARFDRIPKTAPAIGLDIGGTKISAARVSLETGLTDYNRMPTPKRGEEFLAAIESLVKPLIDTGASQPLCLGIASAGTINSETGEIFGATGNLPALRDIGPLVPTLKARLNIPVFIENDANAAAYGEARMGAARGYSEVLMITLGTGVGAGIMVHNSLVRGAHFSAAEAGHIAISMTQDRLCTCGRWDCWETYASGTGLAETAKRQLRAAPNPHGSVMLQSGKAIDDITTHDLLDAFRENDPIAQEIMEMWHYHIATGLGSMLNVLDPEITVVSGGMGKYVNYEQLLELTTERAMYRKDLKIVPAELENQAGMMGAALLALERVCT